MEYKRYLNIPNCLCCIHLPSQERGFIPTLMVKFNGLLPSPMPRLTAKTKAGYLGEPELRHEHQNPSKFCSSELPGGGGATRQLGSCTLERSPGAAPPGARQDPPAPRAAALTVRQHSEPQLHSPQHLSPPLLELPFGK